MKNRIKQKILVLTELDVFGFIIRVPFSQTGITILVSIDQNLDLVSVPWKYLLGVLSLQWTDGVSTKLTVNTEKKIWVTKFESIHVVPGLRSRMNIIVCYFTEITFRIENFSHLETIQVFAVASSCSENISSFSSDSNFLTWNLLNRARRIK